MFITSCLNLETLLFIIFFILQYLFINLGVKLLNPNKSSVTKIYPSQCLDAPIPMVGTVMDFDIILAKFSSTHSITIANTPA